MADIGYASLMLALIFAAYSAIVSIANVRRKSPALALSARNGLIATAVFYTLAIEAMLYALITDDFGIELVASHSSHDLSLIYKFTALYSDKAGSLLFWGWLVSVFAVILVWSRRRGFKDIMPHSVGVLAVILVFFLVLVTIVVNVFRENPHSLSDGLGLNPQLQNPGMAIHPPLLFLGYAGFAIVFAVGVGALIRGGEVDDWLSGIRRWALFAWGALGLANLAGAWWAHDVGGWGGYWAWDPVENAGLMPWLLGTALLHSVAAQRKRGYLKSWGIALIIFTFVFTLLSPFITHGGFEESPLHGFADSPVPPYILSFMVIVLAGSFGLVFLRRGRGRIDYPESLISREGALFLTNIVLGLITLLVLIGTVAPGIADALGRNVAIERDFFDWSAGPAFLFLVLLMGICPLLKWRKSSLDILRGSLLYPVLLSAVAAMGVLIAGIGNWYALAALVCGFPLFGIAQELVRGARARHRAGGQNYIKAFLSLIWHDRPRYGGFIVHIGIILITVGVIGSSLCSDDFMVNLIWAGGGGLLLGGAIAFWPDRVGTHVGAG